MQSIHMAHFYNYETVYSAAYRQRIIAKQGWMYISENYLGFYSFILGMETKLLLELKDIQNITKEKSKSGMIPDSIKIATKDGNEVFMQKSNNGSHCG